MNITAEQEKRIASLIKRQLKGMLGKTWLDKGFSSEQLSQALRRFLVNGQEISIGEFWRSNFKRLLDAALIAVILSLTMMKNVN